MLSFEVSAVDIVMIIAVFVLLILQVMGDQVTKMMTGSKRAAFSAVAAKLCSSRLQILASWSLAVLGSLTVAWVGWSIWYDATTWGKDVALILLGSRTGEAISLGIGMKVLDYFLIGLILILSGLLMFLRRRNSS